MSACACTCIYAKMPNLFRFLLPPCNPRLLQSASSSFLHSRPRSSALARRSYFALRRKDSRCPAIQGLGLRGPRAVFGWEWHGVGVGLHGVCEGRGYTFDLLVPPDVELEARAVAHVPVHLRTHNLLCQSWKFRPLGGGDQSVFKRFVSGGFEDKGATGGPSMPPSLSGRGLMVGACGPGSAPPPLALRAVPTTWCKSPF